MKNVWGILGGGLFLLLTLRQAVTYGQEWEFGPKYGMPVCLLAADGLHYRDGSEVDAVTLALAQSGQQEELELLPMGALLGFVALLLGVYASRWRSWQRRCRLRAFLDAADECQRAGRREDAEEAFRRFEELWAKDRRNPPLRPA